MRASHSQQAIVAHLKDRALFYDSTPDIEEFLSKPRFIYGGFDLTSDALHLGNLMVLLTLLRFKQFGHHPIILLGGATTKIGDPGGKDQERPLLSYETICSNQSKIENFLRSLFGDEAIFVNNADWFDKMTVADYLRDIGRYFRISIMLSKDSVKNRLDSEEGMSYTEFSYQLLQGYDFVHLKRKFGPMVQIGGSDQWGNMISGVEFGRRIGEKDLGVLTLPLMLRKDGKKFGKSEGGAIYLSKEKTSPYKFYQYLITLPDEDVKLCLKRFTFLELEEIETLQGLDQQKRLAEELTLLIHKEEGLKEAKRLTEIAFSQTLGDKKDYDQIFDGFPHFEGKKGEWIGKPILDLLVQSKLIPSKSEGVRLIKGQGLRLNQELIQDPKCLLDESHLIGHVYLIAQQGKKNKILIKMN